MRFICIWDDDAVLINSWTEVLTILDEQKYDFYIFNWKLGDDISSINNSEWIKGNDNANTGAFLIIRARLRWNSHYELWYFQ